MNIASLGGGSVVVDGSSGMWLIDPIGPKDEVWALSQRAELPSALLQACRGVVLTTTHPLHFDPAMLAAVVDGRALLTPSSVLTSLPPELTRHATRILAPATGEWIDLDGMKARFERAGDGADHALRIVDDGRACLIAGLNRNLSLLPALAPELAPKGTMLVAPVDREHPLRVQAGGARGFCHALYQERMFDLAGTALASGAELYLVGQPITFFDRASWLSGFASPVPRDQCLRDLRHAWPSLRVQALEVGSWSQGTAARLTEVTSTRPAIEPEFDPTRGIPALRCGTARPRDLDAELERCFLRVLARYPSLGPAIRDWDIRIQIRQRGAGTDRLSTVRFGEDQVEVSSGGHGLANVFVTVTAEALASVLCEGDSAYRLALRDELRVAEKVFRVVGDSVLLPTWYGRYPPRSSPQVGFDRALSLLCPLDILDALSDCHHAVPWPMGLHG